MPLLASMLCFPTNAKPCESCQGIAFEEFNQLEVLPKYKSLFRLPYLGRRWNNLCRNNAKAFVDALMPDGPAEVQLTISVLSIKLQTWSALTSCKRGNARRTECFGTRSKLLPTKLRSTRSRQPRPETQLP